MNKNKIAKLLKSLKELNLTNLEMGIMWGGIILILNISLCIGWPNSRYLPTLDKICLAGISIIFDKGFISNVLHTLSSYFTGLMVGSIFGYFLGVFVILNKWAKNYVMLIADILRPFPSVALIPIAIMLMGLGLKMKVFIIAYGVVWPILISTIYGAENIGQETLEMVENLRIPRKQFVFQVAFPASLPFLISGLRNASGIALLLSLSVEILAGGNGLGNQIIEMRFSSNIAGVYFVIFFIGLMGFSLNKILVSLENWYLRSFV